MLCAPLSAHGADIHNQRLSLYFSEILGTLYPLCNWLSAAVAH